MPKRFQYKPDSLIYCKGEIPDTIFLLQSGKVSLIYADIESGHDLRHQVQPGEFFGVRSTLGHFPREENAISTTNTTITGFTVPEFEELVMSNTRIIIKMLTVFSKQMRRTHAQVSSFIEAKKIKPDKGLFNIGVKYLKTKRYAYAKYVFTRYLALYPDGEDAKEAKKNLQTAEACIAAFANTGKKAAPKKTADLPQNSAASKAYYDALSLMSELKYEEALEVLNQIINANEDPGWTEKSSYEAGHCLLMLNKFEDCIKYYVNFLSLYPEYPDTRDAMYYIGQAYENLDNREKAMSWYKKIIVLSGEERDGTRTRAMEAYKALEKES